MAFLKDLVDCNERLECLDLVGENWLPELNVSSAFSYDRIGKLALCSEHSYMAHCRRTASRLIRKVLAV
jgi:hypothetical protein